MIFILGLPRSRTKWLSEFLRTNKCKSSHEESIRHPTLESLYKSGYDVICDTGLVLLWRELKGKVILIDRPLKEVKESVRKIGLSTENLDLVKAALDEARMSCITIPYHRLNDEDVCRELFQYVTHEPFDRERWLRMKDKRIVCDVDALVEEVNGNLSNIKQMYGKEG